MSLKNSRQIQVADVEPEKTCANASCLILVLLLIGWKVVRVFFFFKPITKRADANPKQMWITPICRVKAAAVEEAEYSMACFFVCSSPLRVIRFCRSWKDPFVTWRTVTSFQTFVELVTCVKQILLHVQASEGLVFRRWGKKRKKNIIILNYVLSHFE